MNNSDKTFFSKEITIAPYKKRLKSPEDDQNSKGKKSKVRCNAKSILQNETLTTRNGKIAENLEDDDRANSKVQHSRTKVQESFINKLNTISEKTEKELKIENETNIYTAEHSINNNNHSELSANQRYDTSSFTKLKSSSEDVQSEKIDVSNSTNGKTAETDNFPDNANFQITLNTMENETDTGALVAYSISNDARAKFGKQQENYNFSTENQNQKIRCREFNFTSTETFTEHKIDNDLATNSITDGEAFDPRNQKDNTCFITQNLDTGLVQTLPFHFISPETVSNNFSITESILTSQTINSSDIFYAEKKEPEIPLKLPSNFYVNLDENFDLEDTGSDLNAHDIILEEAENKRFQAETSKKGENMKQKYVSEYMLKKQSQAHTETFNVVTDTKCKNNQSSTNNEKRVKRNGSWNSSFSDSNLERCSQSNTTRELRNIKKRSKVNIMAKYSVENSNTCIKSRKSEQRPKVNLQTFIKNSLKDRHPELCLQDDIGMRLEIFLWDMLYRIGKEAENLVLFSKKQLFDKRALKYAIKLALEKMKKEADVEYAKRNDYLF